MSPRVDAADVPRALTIMAVGLFVLAAGAFVLGEFLVAGVAFLSLTFAIYLRETW